MNVVGPPLTVAEWLPLTTHWIVNQGSVTFTGSLKVSEIDDPVATSVAPFDGTLETRLGALSEPHVSAADAEFRGLGAAIVKSAELLSVSVQPLFARSAADVLEVAGVGVVSAQLATP